MKHIILYLIFSLVSVTNIFSQQLETKNSLSDLLLSSVKFVINNKIDRAEKNIRNFIDSQPTIKEKKKTCYKVSTMYNNHLFYILSLDYALEGLNYPDTSLYLLAELNQVIIINHLDLNNYDLAEVYYHKTNQIKAKNKSTEANNFNLIGEINRLRGDYLKSIFFYKKAININKTESYKESLVINYNNIGLSYLFLGYLDSATFYLEKSMDLIDILGLSNRKSAINISFGELYLKKGEYQRSLTFFKNTLKFDLSNHPDKFEVLQDSYKGMKSCYEFLGDYENALKSYEKFQDYREIILNYKKNASVLQKQISIERETHKRELSLINSKLELERKYKLFLVITIGAILLIIVLIIYILKSRNKRIKQKIELSINKNRIQELEIDKMKLSQERLGSELIQSKQEQKIKELEQIALEDLVQSKNRELTSTAIHLLSKNELLNQIQEKLLPLDNLNEEVYLKRYKEIKFLISDSLRLDEDWQVFKKHFTDVHPLFFKNLKKNYPDLTVDELKLCSYLKIQLSSKEIARLINITVAAVNKRRNRLRKKLLISADEDFNDFFIRN